jgi:hypothetical protein
VLSLDGENEFLEGRDPSEFGVRRDSLVFSLNRDWEYKGWCLLVSHSHCMYPLHTLVRVMLWLIIVVNHFYHSLQLHDQKVHQKATTEMAENSTFPLLVKCPTQSCIIIMHLRKLVNRDIIESP